MVVRRLDRGDAFEPRGKNRPDFAFMARPMVNLASLEVKGLPSCQVSCELERVGQSGRV